MLKVVGASWENTRLTIIMLGTVTVIAIFAIFFFEGTLDINDGNYAAIIYWSKNSGFSFKFLGQGNNPQDIHPGVGRAYYRPDMSSTGWATLEIQTEQQYPDWVQAHAAGLLEGSLCWQLIFWHWQNTVAYNCESHREFCDEVRSYLSENAEKIRKIALQNDKTSPLWHQVNLFFAQLDGLEIGWRHGVTRSRKHKEIDIPQIDFMWMNAIADIRDLGLKYNLTKSLDPDKIPTSITLLKLLTGNKENFLLTHSSAGYYNEMLRVQKYYNFGFHFTYNSSALVPGQAIEFTSYPAAIHSQDDFYQISGHNKFIVSGSAIRNCNSSIWDSLDNEKLLMGPRVMAANRLAHNGSEWGKILGSSNGGTGMKQWLILKPLVNTPQVWIVEQIPSRTITQDQTNILQEKGYLALYGFPHYEEIRGLTGYNNEDQNVHRFFDHVKELIDKGQKNITNRESLLNFMRSPEMTIVGRSDIREMDSIFLFGTNDTYSGLQDINHSVSQEANTSSNMSVDFSNSVQRDRNDSESEEIIKSELKTFLGNFELLMESQKKDNQTNELEVSSNKKNNSEIKQFKIKRGGVLRKELNGNLDLKISGRQGFQAIAGPPYTGSNSFPQIDPFQWSKSMFRDVPHYGQSDIWKFGPMEPKWVWR